VTTQVNVAEAKAKLSDVMDRVVDEARRKHA